MERQTTERQWETHTSGDVKRGLRRERDKKPEIGRWTQEYRDKEMQRNGETEKDGDRMIEED